MNLRRLVMALLLGLTVCIYWPGLSGGFNFDDGPNIVNNDALHARSWSFDDLWQASLSGNAGPLKRPVSMLSFALNYLTTGLDPFYFKLTNLAIHLVNGLLVYWLCMLLMQALRECCGSGMDERTGGWVAVLAAGAWLVNPINLTGVLYIVQRMTSLSALFTLLGVCSYVHARLRMVRGQTGGPAWMVFGTVTFGALAVLSKENGALLALFAAACELSLLRFKVASARDRRWVLGYQAVFVVLPGLAALAYLVSMPAWLAHSYIARPFTMEQRLLTEARVLFYYLRLILVPSSASLGLFHDDFGLSHSLFQPFTTAVSIAGLGLLLVLAWRSRRRYPVLTFAVLWFLAGQVMESTVLSLELVHEHRNYLPAIGPLLALFYFLGAAVVTSPELRRAMRIAAVGLIGVFSLVTFVRAEEWRDPFSLAVMQVLHHPDSGRAQYELGRLYFIAYANGTKKPGYLAQAREHFLRAAALDKTRQKPLFALIDLAFLEGREPAPALLHRLDRRISSQPFQSGDTVDLIALVKCQEGGHCRLKHRQILGIFDAALRNPTVGRAARTVILTWQGTYYANVLKDYQRAETILRRVVELEPHDVVYRTNLIQVLVINGRLEQAREQLRAAQRYDTLDAHRDLIDRYRRAINHASDANNEAATAQAPSAH